MFGKYKIHNHEHHEKDYNRKRRGFKKFLNKMKGGDASPPPEHIIDIIWSGIGTFLSMTIIFSLDVLLDSPLLVASIGASAILVFCMPKSPYSQPRTVIGGHVISAIVGVTAYQLFIDNPLWAVAFAVSFSAVLMLLTKTVHPPGGATALFAVIGTEELHQWGYLYVLFPCAISAIVLVLLGLLINNLSARRKYPTYWW